MRRISPLGGGGGNELVMLRNMPKPTFQMNHTNERPMATQTIVPNVLPNTVPNTAQQGRSRDVR